MGVTVDDVSLEVDRLGLSTVGEVLSHVARGNRLVVQLLLDGSEPDLGRIDVLRSETLSGRTLFIETVQPLDIARDVLESVGESMREADALRIDAAEQFRAGQASAALQKLSGCFALWINGQDSIGKVAKLLKLDLTRVQVDTRSAEELLAGFAGQLRQLRDALEARDHVLCCDVLTYDMESARQDWEALVEALLLKAQAA